MAENIRKAKQDHWTDWLENIDARQIYLVNKYMVREPTDMSCARILELTFMRNGMPELATTSMQKVEVLAESLFPPPLRIP